MSRDLLLDSLRYEGDFWADQIIREAAQNAEGTSLKSYQDFVDHFSPKIINDLLQARTLPDWVQFERLERAAEIFNKYKGIIVIILATASLIECYACEKGVKVLYHSKRLSSDTYNRINETAQFILNVMNPVNLKNNITLSVIQKVRFIHAFVRYKISQKGWDEDRLGIPINQEDLLGTLFSFSTVVITNLEKFGIKLSAQQKEDYYYFWRVIGILLGIRKEIIPETFEEAIQLQEKIFKRNQAPSMEGTNLTRSLITLLTSILKIRVIKGIIPALIRFQVGDEVSDWFKVPITNWSKILNPKGKFLSIMIRRTTFISKLLNNIGEFYLKDANIL